LVVSCNVYLLSKYMYEARKVSCHAYLL
jgi:hypothetical protein